MLKNIFELPIYYVDLPLQAKHNSHALVCVDKKKRQVVEKLTFVQGNNTLLSTSCFIVTLSNTSCSGVLQI